MKSTESKLKFWAPKLAATFAIILVMVSFQNCSKVNFSEDVSSAVKTAGIPDNVICDPFSSASSCDPNSGDGLRGNVYYLPNEKNSVQNYIDYGTKLNLYVQMSNLDIPTRDWSSGFPSSAGGLLKDQNGAALIEYFGMDLKGAIVLTSRQNEDDYDFAIASDDGAILDIDGKTLVNNDGQHAREWKCSSDSVHLKVGESHPVRLRYYQGPRVQIALQVYMRPVSKRGMPCDDTGDWTILPKEILRH